MLPNTPPNVKKFGVYKVDETCELLWCCRDTLRKISNDGQIERKFLDDDTIVYYAIDILRYWFRKTKQHYTEEMLNKLLDSMSTRGYESTIGCPPPVRPSKKTRQKRQ